MQNNAVSQSPVSWHLEHVLLAVNSIINALKKSNPQGYKRTFNFKRTLIFVTRHIPRGKVQSPERVRPKGDITEKSLAAHLASTFTHIDEISKLPANSYFKHPVMGDLNVKAAVRFIEIHTRHHAHIIRDILKL